MKNRKNRRANARSGPIALRTRSEGDDQIDSVTQAALDEINRRSAEPEPTPVAPAPAPEPVAVRSDNSDSVLEAERLRVRKIRELFAPIDAKRGAELIDNGTSIQQASFEAIQRLSTPKPAAPPVAAPSDSHENSVRSAVLDSLSSRMGVAGAEAKDLGMRNDSLIDVCRAYLNCRGQSVRGVPGPELAKRALSTSDFPLLLADVANKTLRNAYMEAPQPFRQLVAMTTVPDFKAVNWVSTSGVGDLDIVLEGGEYKMGTLTEGNETFSVSKYGKIIPFTWELIVNDDLSAFQRVTGSMGAAARRAEEKAFFNLLIANPTLSDGNPLFDAAHNNVGTGAIGVAGLSDAMEALMLQTGLTDEYLGLNPKYLVGPVQLMVAAKQWLSSTTVPSQPSEVNPFTGVMQFIPSAYLSADDANQFYVFADPAILPSIVLAHMRGYEAPQFDTKQEFHTDGVSYKIRHIFGVAAVDHRGVYRSTGV